MHTTATSSVPQPAGSELTLRFKSPASTEQTTLHTGALDEAVSRADETDSLLFQQPKGPGSGLPSDRKGKSRALPDANGNGESQDFLALDIDGDRGESGTGGDGYQQMQLVEQQVCRSFHSSLPSRSQPSHLISIISLRPEYREWPVLSAGGFCRSLPDWASQSASMLMRQDDYIQSRSTAIESIESTISELGQIFSQLAGMVAEQRETVQRIDADTTDIAAYVHYLRFFQSSFFHRPYILASRTHPAPLFLLTAHTPYPYSQLSSGLTSPCEAGGNMYDCEIPKADQPGM